PRAASCGASLKLLGNCAGSVTTSGPSSFPTRSLPAGPAAAAYCPIHPDAASTQSVTASHRLSPVVCICRGPLMVSPLPVVTYATESHTLYDTYAQAGAFIAGFPRGVNRSASSRLQT